MDGREFTNIKVEEFVNHRVDHSYWVCMKNQIRSQSTCRDFNQSRLARVIERSARCWMGVLNFLLATFSMIPVIVVRSLYSPGAPSQIASVISFPIPAVYALSAAFASATDRINVPESLERSASVIRRCYLPDCRRWSHRLSQILRKAPRKSPLDGAPQGVGVPQSP